MKMYVVATLLAVLSLTNAGAFPVVKIRSQVCGSGNDQAMGSGVVVRQGTNMYIVSSEHAVVASSQICATAETDSQSKMDLTLLASDYGTGMAMYKINNPPARLESIGFDEFQSSPDNASKQVVTVR
jgi:S1-C subfamily serine protease